MTAAPTPLAYLHTAGPAGDPVTQLGWALAAVSIGVIVIVGALLLAAVFRRGQDRSQPADRRTLEPSRPQEGLRWIVVGTAISTVVLLACAALTLSTLAAVSSPPATPRVTIEVRGYQFWWRVRYLDEHDTPLLTTANEIHIPAGEPVRFRLTSSDVIHSFWVPALGGKTDAIPGQTNVTWLQADRPGRYRGQCTEYCGQQHAHMALFVDADAPADFARWMAAQRTAAATTGATPVRGEDVFENRCGGCHAVRGTAADGALAPDLTHLMSRQTIAAGALPNDADDLRRWIGHTQQVKPGSAMPNVTLRAEELDAVVAYLTTLH